MNVLNFMQSFFTDGSHWHGYDGIPQRVWEHVQYTAGALAIAAAIGLPIGLATGHTGRGGNALAFVSAGARALPTFGLLVLMFVWLGLGIVPVMIPLVVLAIPRSSSPPTRRSAPWTRHPSTPPGAWAWRSGRSCSRSRCPRRCH